ncbi:hypothetical protein DPMN_000878 [Dreissena polymorpha]|uniref:Uncharacterized protein n=1 Tax=Dreissena polymorpha TaxID=45954 RepID=A0A9D4MJ49_DREPO|nr:hypothetical protein DPMN_000878 [Dreissena polymorpha]
MSAAGSTGSVTASGNGSAGSTSVTASGGIAATHSSGSVSTTTSSTSSTATPPPTPASPAAPQTPATPTPTQGPSTASPLATPASPPTSSAAGAQGQIPGQAQSLPSNGGPTRQKSWELLDQQAISNAKKATSVPPQIQNPATAVVTVRCHIIHT